MPTTDRPRRDQESSGTGMAAAGIDAAVLMIVCCAGPALVAAGTLGALGGFLGNPWVIAAAIVVLVAAVTAVVRRRHSGRDVCCPPAKATDNSADLDHPHTPADQEGPRSR
uniref:MerT n=1 Tax=Streptomyces sp. F12 TaxID=1436084 RepID=V9Z9Z5_9ACTN|nr:hypothetical protein [Streptomyces sp. F12]AHE40251.1 merT [Streptomyces sp. F12]